MRGSSTKGSPLFLGKLFSSLFIIMAIWMINNDIIQGVYGDLSPSQCKQQRKGLENSCKPVAFGFEPSADCCAKVRAANVQCVCPYLTPKLAAIIGVERAVKKIEGCGRHFPPNFKCGSITFP